MNDFRLMRYGFIENKVSRVTELIMYFSTFLENEELLGWRSAK